MVSIETGLAINTATAVDRTTAGGMRRVLASLFAQSAVGQPTPGIIAINGLTPLDVTTDGTDMTYHVAAGYAVTSRTGQGAYIVGDVDAVDITGVSVGDGSNPRIDRIYIVQPDPELTETGVARIDVVEGTPGASPALPALPTGALELARKLVPSGASNTDTGTALTDKATTTSLNVTWDGLIGKPTTFAPSTHTHVATQISDSTTIGRTVLKAADVDAILTALGVTAIGKLLMQATDVAAARAAIDLYIDTSEPADTADGVIWGSYTP